MFLFALTPENINWISVISSLIRNGLNITDVESPVRIAVNPGFSFRNQWLGKKPNIEIVPFSDGPAAIDLARNLDLYPKLDKGQERSTFSEFSNYEQLHKVY